MVEQFVKYIELLMQFFVTERVSSALFKVALALLTGALVAWSQVGPFLYDKDISVHKAKFALEIAMKQPIDKIDCNVQTNLQLDCMATKYELRTFNASLELFERLTQMAFLSGAVSFIVSGIIFLSNAVRCGNTKSV